MDFFSVNVKTFDSPKSTSIVVVGGFFFYLDDFSSAIFCFSWRICKRWVRINKGCSKVRPF